MLLAGEERNRKVEGKKKIEVSVREGDRLCVCVRGKERERCCVLLIIHEA